MRVQLARLEGRLDGVQRGLDRQEQACESRSRSHVDRELYTSEQSHIRDDIRDHTRQIAELKADVNTERREREQAMKEAEQTRRRDRQFWLAAVAIPTIGLLITLIGVLT